jgi:hypothetical protein
MYRMSIQAIAVETAEIIGTRTINIRYDSTLTVLLGRINPADQWKYQWLYAGINIGYSATVMAHWGHNYGLKYAFDIPFGYGIYMMVQPFDLFGVTLDFGGNMYEGPILSILPTLIIRPSIFEVDIFLGIGAVILQTSTAELSFIGGTRVGMKVGPGVLFADIRPIVSTGPGYYYAFFINATVGYQLGFIPRKK